MVVMMRDTLKNHRYARVLTYNVGNTRRTSTTRNEPHLFIFRHTII